MDLPWLDPSTLSPLDAVAALRAALAGGLDPEAGPARSAAPAPGGELLLMPAAHGAYAGVKVVSVAPGNATLGLPRIQGVYLLFDGATLTPLALVDGAALTSVRTPAVSMLAVAALTPHRPLRTVVFGRGPQARAHIEALHHIRPGSTAALVSSADPRPDLSDADLVICATTAGRPVFDGSAPPDGCCVVAVGSHEPGVREVDEVFVRRATVYAEARSVAATCGELRDLPPGEIVALAGLPGLAGGTAAEADLGRPRLFKSVGMAWEDLVVAAALHQRLA
ncbi:ornithine cyclodeaminase family protein [Hamadaea tsunoensis]|uniref:ornithine cyclodeaminase family protein n=1 Tax=Hamadaea tsunoensis TaxID=53368 RepID=UPI0004208859|nr:hypothetical protein [Hamadaea tsunoensis]